jgi:uncharacterized membrane protein YfcA
MADSGTWQQVAALLCAAFSAGAVDAIAGGGGLITLPALLWVGLPPHVALGTNKGQSIFGTTAAILRYRHAGLIDGGRAPVSFGAGFLGSLGGAAIVLLVRPALLRPLVLVLLVMAALVIALRRPGRPEPGPVAHAERPLDRASPGRRSILAAAIALAIGGYDGFFGPGTGTFLIVAYSVVFAMPLGRASAEAKVVNFASNLAALSIFSMRGTVLWRLALPMAAAQFAGGALGAHFAVRGGDSRVRWVVLGVVAALVLKLGLDLLRAGT